MDKREELELAALAAGIRTAGVEYDKRFGFMVCHSTQRLWWNPRDDDGDAFRLMVACYIDAHHFMHERGHMFCTVDRLGKCFIEPVDPSDRAAATRLAITRAAAAVGKQMREEVK